jgi:hypothetical protein
MMESESKEAAMEGVDTLPPAAAAAAASGEELTETPTATAETGHLPHSRSVARYLQIPLALTWMDAP